MSLAQRVGLSCNRRRFTSRDLLRKPDVHCLAGRPVISSVRAYPGLVYGNLYSFLGIGNRDHSILIRLADLSLITGNRNLPHAIYDLGMIIGTELGQLVKGYALLR